MSSLLYRTIFLLSLVSGVICNDLLTSNEDLFVSKMQEVFMIKDGSIIVDSRDVTVVSALRKELRSMLKNYTEMRSLDDIRNVTLVNNDDMVLILMLAVMGNFHRKSVTNANVYDDVQIVFDPLDGKFEILQNLRDTEMTVFKALLVISVAGLLLIFMTDKNIDKNMDQKTESKGDFKSSIEPLHSMHAMHDHLPTYPIHTIKFRK